MSAGVAVLLHAFPLDHSMWDDVLDEVSTSGWDLVVPDLRGFGASRYGPDGPTDPPSLTAMARDVLAAVGRIDSGPVAVAGVSMGGYVAMELLRLAPERVGALALIDTKPGADGPDARANRLRVAEQILATGDTEALATAMLPGLVGETTRRSRPTVVDRVRRLVVGADPAGVAWAQRAMAARPDSSRELAAFTGPSLVVWGEEDTLSPRADQETMLELLQHNTFRAVPGAGHLAVMEEPALVATALVEFLTGLP